MAEMESKLKAFFPEEDLEWRVQSCGINGNPWAMVLCYIQARAIQNRLDEVIGFENWKDEYRVEGTNIICRLSLRLGGEWVAKENGASETDIEAFKGGISGAFKRVASSGFGIGRYLYDLDATFAECSLEKQKGWNKAKTRDNKVIYWKTPKMDKRFLPNTDTQNQNKHANFKDSSFEAKITDAAEEDMSESQKKANEEKLQEFLDAMLLVEGKEGYDNLKAKYTPFYKRMKKWDIDIASEIEVAFANKTEELITNKE